MRIMIAVVVLAAFAGCVDETDGNGPAVNECTQHPRLGDGNPHVVIETNLGNITAEIFVDKVPNTGMNFVKLAEEGTYDGSPFHRIITDFMMQGGDHTRGTGTGGEASPDCADEAGNIPDEFHQDLRHDKPGMLSMANAGANTGSSQFFITFQATSWLDGHDSNGNPKNCASRTVSCHPVFGQVVEGMDVVEKVNADAGSSSGTPRTPVTFLKATVEWPNA